MRFDLTHPCTECPFRQDGKRIRRRAAAAILRYRGPFPCHKTVDYESSSRWRDRGGRAQACAGRLALAAAAGETAVLALAARLGDSRARAAHPEVVATAAEFLDRMPKAAAEASCP